MEKENKNSSLSKSSITDSTLNLSKQINKTLTSNKGLIKTISDIYLKFSDNPIISTIYDGTNAALYLAAPFTGGATLIPAMSMSGILAVGASANVYDKGLNVLNGLDIASAIPGFGLTEKAVKMGMKPVMKTVGKTTKRVKSATKYVPVKESKPYTYTRMERVGNSGSRRVIRPVEHTIELGRHRPTFWQLAAEDKAYWPAAAMVYGEDILNHGLNTYQIIKDILNKKQGGKMNILEFLKNGSGIHIKKKNRGKFTSYCGGKVTDECILKGKNSSDPAVRKRATFAANARKWKHLQGGTIGLKINNWFKSDLGKVVTNGVSLLYTGLQENANLVKLNDLLQEWKKSYLKSIQPEDFSTLVNQEEALIKQSNPDYNSSPLVKLHKLYLLLTQALNRAREKAGMDADQYIQLYMLAQQNNSSSGDIFSGMLKTFLG